MGAREAVPHKPRRAAPKSVRTPSFRLVRISKKGGSLSKRISRNTTGLIEVDSSACAMARGTASTIAIDTGMAGLSALYQKLGPNEALVFSNVELGHAPREVCTKDTYASARVQDPNVICRSKQFLGASNDPGLQLFEVDDHGQPHGGLPPNADRMIDILEELLPELDGRAAAQILTHSTSSYIYDACTGNRLKGEGGKHLAMLLSNQAEAARLKTLLEIRQWAMGYGCIYIARDGKQLPRTVFDLSVFAPERLVFEAGAQLGEGLTQRRPSPVSKEGHALDMAALPLPSLLERELAEAAKTAALLATLEASTQKRSEYVRDEAQNLVAQRGITAPDATRIVEQRTDTGCLDDGDLLVFTDRGQPEPYPVSQVLDHLEDFIGRSMCDPIEPEYGFSKAMIIRGPGGRPHVESFAHGGRRFTFSRIVGCQGAGDQALFSFSDLANAHRIAKGFGQDLLATTTGWFVFNGARWERGDQLAERIVLNLSRLVLSDAKYIALVAKLERNEFRDETERKTAQGLRKTWECFAAECENRAKLKSALEIARTLLWRDVSEMNQDPWLLNVMNGTLNLRSGQLQPHSRDDLIRCFRPVTTALRDMPHLPEYVAPNF